MTERIDTVGAEGAILHGLAAVGAGVANNALIQMLGTLPPLQIVLLRAFGAIAILGPIWLSQRPRVPSRLAILRAGLEAAGTLPLVMALSRATLSFVAMIMMTIPIGVMAVGAFLIGDPVSRRGRGLIFVCFAAAQPSG